MVSLPRSHSQALARGGRPKTRKNGYGNSPSGNCTARVPAREAPELFGHAGGVAHRVEQCLRADPAGDVMREVLRIAGVGRVGLAGRLIHARVHDRADQVLAVEPWATKSAVSASSSAGLLGGLVPRKSSTGSTTPATEQVEPDAIGRGAGEVRDSPAPSASANAPRRSASAIDAAAPGSLAFATLPLRGCGHLGITLGEDRFFLVVNLDEEGPIAILHAGEERGQGVVIILSPVLAGVVVALRAAASARP